MKQQLGVTLIELLVTISIAVILLAVAVPSFRDFMIRNQLASITTDIMGSLNIARSEAITRGKDVYVCTGNDCTGCQQDCIDDWSGGWIIYIDENADGSYDSSGPKPDIRLRSYRKLPTGYTLNDQGYPTQVHYKKNGAAGSTGLFAICHDDTTATGITLNVSTTSTNMTSGVVDCTP